MTKDIEHIVFGLGGVLVSGGSGRVVGDMVNYLGISRAHYNQLRERFKDDITYGEMSLEQFYEKVLDICDRPITPRKALIKHLDSYITHTSSIDPEVWELIEELGENYKISSITNTELEIAALSKARHLFDLFYASFISTEMQAKYPDRDFYKKVLVGLNSPPENVILIDNDSVAVAAAKEMRINAIEFLSALDTKLKLKTFGVKSAGE